MTAKPNSAVDTYPIPSISIYASCSIGVYNVTLNYNGAAGEKPWRLIPEQTVQSEERFATALIAPYSWQLLTERLTTNIKAQALIAATADEVMALLNQELSRLALGFVSGSFELAPAADVQITIPTILGRYHLAPLLVFVGLLLLYSLIALVIFARTFNVAFYSVIVPSQLGGTPHSKKIPVLSYDETAMS
jgi:hypothetical protein